MADLLPAFPAGLWLMAASMLVRITRFARAFSLISPASAIILIRLVGSLHRSGFHAWRRNGGNWRWAGIWRGPTSWGTASRRTSSRLRQHTYFPDARQLNTPAP